MARELKRMYFFFDTETTGLPRNPRASVSDLMSWPRVVQLAWLLVDEQGNDIHSAEYLIKPDGYVIPSSASRIHGITTDIALQNGVELLPVLTSLVPVIQQSKVLVAHNLEFDEKILGAEFLRAKLANPLTAKSRQCTMKASTDYCGIPGRYGFKWPNLQELYMRLFNETIENAHQALADVRACARCYFELKRLGIMI